MDENNWRLLAMENNILIRTLMAQLTAQGVIPPAALAAAIDTQIVDVAEHVSPDDPMRGPLLARLEAAAEVNRHFAEEVRRRQAGANKPPRRDAP